MKDLNEFVLQWNTHPIWNNHLADCPSGIPVDMYEIPDAFGKHYKKFNYYYIL